MRVPVSVPVKVPPFVSSGRAFATKSRDSSSVIVIASTSDRKMTSESVWLSKPQNEVASGTMAPVIRTSRSSTLASTRRFCCISVVWSTTS